MWARDDRRAHRRPLRREGPCRLWLRGKLNARLAALRDVLNGRFDDPHVDLAQLLLHEIDV